MGNMIIYDIIYITAVGKLWSLLLCFIVPFQVFVFIIWDKQYLFSAILFLFVLF